MSYIEILLLRHLTRRPAHGYELRKRVERTTGVRLNNNSLYPALRRFEEAGAVTRSEQPQEGRPPRLVYALTPLGRLGVDGSSMGSLRLSRVCRHLASATTAACFR